MECLICLTESDSLIGISSEKGRALGLVKTLKTHFPFLENHFRKKKKEKFVCNSCLDTIDQFHSFYVTIKDKHDEKKTHKTRSWQRKRNKIEDVMIKEETDIKEEFENDPWNFDELDQIEAASEKSENEENYNIPVRTELKDEEFKLSAEELDLYSDLEPVRSKYRTRISRIKLDDREDSSEDEVALEINPIRVKKSAEEIAVMKQHKANSIKFVNEFWLSSMVCDICQYDIKGYQDMRPHFLENHKRKTAYLVCCNKRYTLLHKMVDHIKEHQSPETHTCETCNETFPTLRSLDRHKISHEPQEERPRKQYVCSFNGCNKVYFNKYQIKTHRAEAHIPLEDRKFVCKMCSGRFPTSARLKTHHKVVHDQKNNLKQFICDLCGKLLKTRTNLEQHIQYHSDDDSKRIQCQVCFHWLKNKNVFRTHSLRHTRESLENANCLHCGKKLANRQSLASHIRRVHLAQRIFKCTMCEKAFKTKISLKEHTATHRSGEYLYECKVCGKNFNSQSNMHAHRKRLHPKEWAEYLQPKYIKPISEPLPAFNSKGSTDNVGEGENV